MELAKEIQSNALKERFMKQDVAAIVKESIASGHIAREKLKPCIKAGLE